MIFWEDLVKASAAAEKTELDLRGFLIHRELEIKASLVDDLIGTAAQNDARLAAAMLADTVLSGLVTQHAEARSAQIDTRADLDSARLWLEERLVEAHEVNMKIAEKIHGS